MQKATSTYIASGLYPHITVPHMLRNWLLDVDKEEKKCILVGAAVLCWFIWYCRNDIIFITLNTQHFFMLLQEGEHMSSLAMDRTIIIDFAFFSPLFYSTIIDTTGVL
jgi:hypothetical protein